MGDWQEDARKPTKQGKCVWCNGSRLSIALSQERQTILVKQWDQKILSMPPSATRAEASRLREMRKRVDQARAGKLCETCVGWLETGA